MCIVSRLCGTWTGWILSVACRRTSSMTLSNGQCFAGHWIHDRTSRSVSWARTPQQRSCCQCGLSLSAGAYWTLRRSCSELVPVRAQPCQVQHLILTIARIKEWWCSCVRQPALFSIAPISRESHADSCVDVSQEWSSANDASTAHVAPTTCPEAYCSIGGTFLSRSGPFCLFFWYRLARYYCL